MEMPHNEQQEKRQQEQTAFGVQLSQTLDILHRLYAPQAYATEKERLLTWWRVLTAHDSQNLALNELNVNVDNCPSSAFMTAMETLWDNLHSKRMAIGSGRSQLSHLSSLGIPLPMRQIAWSNFMHVTDAVIHGQYPKLWSSLTDTTSDKNALLPNIESHPPPNSLDNNLSSNKLWRSIDKDINRTFSGQAMQKRLSTQALRHILYLYGLRNPSVGYCQGLNFLAGELLLFLSEEQSFWGLCVLVEKILPGYYNEDMAGVMMDLNVLRRLVAQHLPAFMRQLELLGLMLDAFTTPWLVCAFVNCLPLTTTLRVWDIMLAEQHAAVLFRVSLALLDAAAHALTGVLDPVVAIEVLQSVGLMMVDADQLIAAAEGEWGDVTASVVDRFRNEYRPQGSEGESTASTVDRKSNAGSTNASRSSFSTGAPVRMASETERDLSIPSRGTSCVFASEESLTVIGRIDEGGVTQGFAEAANIPASLVTSVSLDLKAEDYRKVPVWHSFEQLLECSHDHLVSRSGSSKNAVSRVRSLNRKVSIQRVASAGTPVFTMTVDEGGLRSFNSISADSESTDDEDVKGQCEQMKAEGLDDSGKLVVARRDLVSGVTSCSSSTAAEIPERTGGIQRADRTLSSGTDAIAGTSKSTTDQEGGRQLAEDNRQVGRQGAESYQEGGRQAAADGQEGGRQLQAAAEGQEGGTQLGEEDPYLRMESMGSFVVVTGSAAEDLYNPLMSLESDCVSPSRLSFSSAGSAGFLLHGSSPLRQDHGISSVVPKTQATIAAAVNDDHSCVSQPPLHAVRPEHEITNTETRRQPPVSRVMSGEASSVSQPPLAPVLTAASEQSTVQPAQTLTENAAAVSIQSQALETSALSSKHQSQPGSQASSRSTAVLADPLLANMPDERDMNKLAAVLSSSLSSLFWTMCQPVLARMHRDAVEDMMRVLQDPSSSPPLQPTPKSLPHSVTARLLSAISTQLLALVSASLVPLGSSSSLDRERAMRRQGKIDWDPLFRVRPFLRASAAIAAAEAVTLLHQSSVSVSAAQTEEGSLQARLKRLSQVIGLGKSPSASTLAEPTTCSSTASSVPLLVFDIITTLVPVVPAGAYRVLCCAFRLAAPEALSSTLLSAPSADFTARALVAEAMLDVDGVNNPPASLAACKKILNAMFTHALAHQLPAAKLRQRLRKFHEKCELSAHLERLIHTYQGPAGVPDMSLPYPIRCTTVFTFTWNYYGRRKKDIPNRLNTTTDRIDLVKNALASGATHAIVNGRLYKIGSVNRMKGNTDRTYIELDGWDQEDEPFTVVETVFVEF